MSTYDLWGKGKGPLWHQPRKMRRSANGNLFVKWLCNGRTVNPVMRNDAEGDRCSACVKAAS